jgi:hypothetical protein
MRGTAGYGRVIDALPALIAGLAIAGAGFSLSAGRLLGISPGNPPRRDTGALFR